MIVLVLLSAISIVLVLLSHKSTGTPECDIDSTSRDGEHFRDARLKRSTPEYDIDSTSRDGEHF